MPRGRVLDCALAMTAQQIPAGQAPLAFPPLCRLLVTGISGNLGRRLAPLLAGYELITADLHPPPAGLPAGKFIQADLSTPEGQKKVAEVIRNEGVEAVLHLAFVIDQVRTGIVDLERMWRANVQATERLLEATSEANRSAPRVRLFVFPSSVSAYGPQLPPLVREDAPLAAHTMPYAVHKRESDEICQRLYPQLGGCALYILRPHIFAGQTVNNYILSAMRGRASGRGWLARFVEKQGWRIPVLLPASCDAGNLFQFIHVDDVARFLLWTLKNFSPGRLEILNLAGRGEPLRLLECAQMSGTPVIRVGGTGTVKFLLKLFWILGLSGVPAEALPYFVGSYTMDTGRLRAALGEDYEPVIQWTSRDALSDAMRSAVL